ncbi:sensor histidine kinase [Streptomyces sp. JNUCC 64]
MSAVDAPWSVLVALPVLACAGTIGWAGARLLAARRAGGTWTAGGTRTGLAPATAVCALLSVLATFALPPDTGAGAGTGPGAGAGAGSGEDTLRSAWSLAEAGLLLVLLVAVVRIAPRRQLRYAVPLVALAVAVWPVPSLTDGSPPEVVGVVVFWTLPVVAAVAVGGYPRRAAARRGAAVEAARREQRSRLSRDLHDFVAHDISGIVVQAQAARFVAESDPGQALLALERIERAGLNALASMDRTVAMLHGDGPGADALPPGPDRLPQLVADFGAAGGPGGSGTPDAVLEADPAAVAALTRETGAAAYRVVVEALTNVRRHAPDATRVVVRVHRVTAGVGVFVTDDGAGGGGGRPARFRLPGRARGTGGLGLPALTEHVTALGGTLTAGPARDAAPGWCLSAVFPDPPGAAPAPPVSPPAGVPHPAPDGPPPPPAPAPVPGHDSPHASAPGHGSAAVHGSGGDSASARDAASVPSVSKPSVKGASTKGSP